MRTLLYRIKWTLWAYWKYHRMVSQMRPWDYMYIFRMMEFQMGLLERYIRDKGIHVGHESDASKISDVRARMARLIEDRYFECDTPVEGYAKEEEDWKWVFKELEIHMREWWD